MKKKLFAILLAATTVTVGLSVFAGCNGGGHTAHTFDKQVTEAIYLKSAASTKNKAVYYYSCECGERGTETFEYGEVLEGTAGLLYLLNDEKTGYSVLGKGTATDTDIVIPAEYEGKPVTAIGDAAFAASINVTSIAIPDSVTYIGWCAFKDCMGLTSIILPNSLTSFGFSAFEGCTSLTSVIIPAGMKTISISGFQSCGALSTIIFKGTKSQWKAITKEESWNYKTGNYVVKCIDGTLSKNQAN